LGLGIDLGDDGVTLNTLGGPHVGPNAFQNTPVIASAAVSGSSTLVRLSLNSIASSLFTIQIFANPTLDPTGYGQGKTLVATVAVNTDATGNLSGGFVLVTVPQILTGQYLSATATAPLGDTSEFGRDMKVAPGIGGRASEESNSDRGPTDVGMSLLIGGTTPDHTNDAALQAIMAEWARTDNDSVAPIATLTSGNGVAHLDMATVTGDDGRDQFFANANLDTTNWAPAKALIIAI